MRGGIATFAALAAVAAAALPISGCGGEKKAGPEEGLDSAQPRVEIVSPRNGARQPAHAVVVKVEIEGFKLAPSHFDGEPRLGEGNLRFSLNRVPDCVDPVKLERALNSPLGKGRLIGRSFDFPRYAGPNGVLAARIGSTGSYSPATRPEIYYQGLPPGFYRLVIVLAQNNGAATPYHAVTNFEILPAPGHGPHKCKGGKVSSAKAAAFN
jgi:hypothetical protein